MIKAEIANIIINIAILLIFKPIYNFYCIKSNTYKQNKQNLFNIIIGIAIGILTICLMINNVNYCQSINILIDSKTILLLFSAIFLGFKPTIIAAAIASVYAILRYCYPALHIATIFHTFETETWYGEPSLGFDLLTITSTTIIGLLFQQYSKALKQKHYIKIITLASFTAHLVVLAFIPLFINPPITYNTLILTPLFALAIPVISIVLGWFLSQNIRQKDIEQYLKHSQELFNKVALCSDDCFWELDIKGYVTFVSDNVTKVTGYNKEEIIGTYPLNLLCNIETKNSLYQYAHDVKIKEDVIFDKDIVLLHKDKSQIHCKARGMKHFNNIGQHIGYIGIVHNTNEQYIQRELLRRNQMQLREQNQQYEQLNAELREKNEQYSSINLALSQAQEQTQKAEQIKKQFIQNISEEIKIPLSYINNYLDSAINSISAYSSNNDTLLINVKHQCDDLALLITNISDNEAGDYGIINITEEVGNMGQFFYEICEYYNQRFNNQVNRRITFTHNISIKGQQQAIKTDYTKLHRILHTLINNAIKYTIEGEIKLSCTLINNDTDICFSVSDTSKGVNAETLNLFFIDKVNGTCIGLAAAKAIIEKMGGSINAQSQIGKGTTISFTIPYHKATQETHTEVYKWSGKSIAVLTKNRFTAIYLTDILIRTGIKYRVFTLEQSRPEVLNYAESGFDCAIVDTRLVKSEFAKSVANFLQNNTADVIALCLAENHQVERFDNLEYSSIIFEPINAGNICANINTILKNKEER